MYLLTVNSEHFSFLGETMNISELFKNHPILQWVLDQLADKWLSITAVIIVGRELFKIVLVVWGIYRYKMIKLLRVPYCEDASQILPAWRSFFRCVFFFLWPWKMAKLNTLKLFDIARAFTEYSIIKRKPKLDDYNDKNKNEFPAELREWKKGITKTLDEVVSGKDPEKVTPIAVETAFSLHDRRKQLGKYFEVMHYIGKRRKLDIDTQNRFNLPVKINAFVSPIYLLCGLLNRFEEDWQIMLGKFREGNTSNANQRATLIWHHQLFTFYCWLQWGPSIPMCNKKCFEWNEDQLALQVGFGDENNSFPMLLGKTQRVRNEELEAFNRLKSSFLDSTNNQRYRLLTGGALPRSFTVFPRCSFKNDNLTNDEDGGPLERLVNAQRHIKEPSMSSGIVLDYMNDDAIPSSQGLPNYYSAYLWMMFVICNQRGEPMYPIEREPHLGLIPFFEHANIADQGSLEVSMRQLATKVVLALDEILQRGTSQVNTFGQVTNPEISFGGGYIVYTCAFDHTGCPRDEGPASTSQLATSRVAEKTLAGMVEAIINKNSSKYGRIIMNVDDINSVKDQSVLNCLKQSRNQFVSCQLPGVIEKLYC
jgi:hypothetical protein